jgi:hypothetical protein
MPTRQDASRKNITARTAASPLGIRVFSFPHSLNNAKRKKAFSFFSFVTCGG